jgi:two-component system, LytTR family, sensor kinase
MLAVVHPGSRLLRWGLIAAAWTLVGGLVVAGSAARMVAQGGGPGSGIDPTRVALTFQSVWLWALLTPLMFWLAARVPLSRARWGRALAAHAGFAIGIHLLDVSLDWGLGWLGLPVPGSFTGMLADELFINVYSYFAVIACGHALAYGALYQERRAREAQLAAALAQSQLEALELQLRPHFLFNALNTVNAQIRTGAGPEAIRTVTQLGDLLRALLQEGAHEVAVREELALVDRYLGIEETRFGGRLSRRVDVAPEVLDALLPRLILQPLAENAIRHGCEKVPGPARVDIAIAQHGDRLRVTVRDSGAGVASSREGIGLGNARERLRRLYGAEHRLALEAAEGGGAVAILEVPFHCAPRGAL